MTGNGIPEPTPEPEKVMGELPEGVGIEDVEEHAVTLQVAGELINRTSAYLSTEQGTPEEVTAERMLEALADKISGSPKMAGSVVLCLASLIVNASDQVAVQTWFTEQAEHVKAALDAR